MRKIQWGNEKNLELEKGRGKFFGFDFRKENGVFIGSYKGKILKDNNNSNILAITPRRTGEGVSLIIPTLIDGWNESVLIYDINGENYNLTSGARKNKYDNMILKFAPFEEKSSKYNPFDLINWNSESENSDIEIILEEIFSNIKDEKIKSQVKTYFKVEIKRQKESKKEINFKNIYNHFIFGENEEVNEKIKEFFDKFNKNLFNSTEKSDFSINDFFNFGKPITLYYSINPDNIENDFIFRIIVSQLFHQNIKNSYFDFENKRKTLLMIPNFGKVNRISNFEKGIEFSINNIKTLISVNRIGEIEEKYGKNNNIFSNMQTKLFYTNDDIDSIKYANEIFISDENEIAKILPNKAILKSLGKQPILIEKELYFNNKENKELIHIPKIIPESLNDKKKQYIKTNNKEIGFKYIPNEYALNEMKQEIEGIEKSIKENYNQNDKYIIEILKLEIDNFNRFVEEYNKINNCKIEFYKSEINFKSEIDFENKEQCFGNFSNLNEIENVLSSKIKNFSLFSENGVFLGEKSGKRIIENSKMHSIIFDDNIGIKNYNYAINLPTLLKTWKESAIILDYKGEAHHLTSGVRKENMNNKILQLNLDSNFSCNYNPFEEIRIMSKFETKDIEDIISPIFEKEIVHFEKIIESETVLDINSSNYKEYLLRKDSKRLFENIVRYLIYREFLKNPEFIIENNKRIPISRLTFKDVSNFLKTLENDISQLYKMENENIIYEYAKDDETKKYIKNKLQELIEDDKTNKTTEQGKILDLKLILNNSTLKETEICFKIGKRIFEEFSEKVNISSNSDFRLFDLMNYEKPVSLYLSFSYELENIEKSRIFYKILLNQFIEKMVSYEFDNHKWKCLLNLKNLSFLGKFEKMYLATMLGAGYGIKLLIDFQSTKHVEEIYGKDSDFIKQYQINIKNNVEKDKMEIKFATFSPTLIDPVYYYKDLEFKNLSEIPKVYSESLIKEEMNYILISNEIKEKYDYKYNYIPNNNYIKAKEKNLKEQEKYIDNLKNNFSNFDGEKRENYEKMFNNYLKEKVNLEKIKKIKKELNI